jgi:hypothetical protein
MFLKQLSSLLHLCPRLCLFFSHSSNPSSEPSAPPTGGLYYPDWENGEQICVNDGADPEFSELY